MDAILQFLQIPLRPLWCILAKNLTNVNENVKSNPLLLALFYTWDKFSQKRFPSLSRSMPFILQVWFRMSVSATDLLTWKERKTFWIIDLTDGTTLLPKADMEDKLHAPVLIYRLRLLLWSWHHTISSKTSDRIKTHFKHAPYKSERPDFITVSSFRMNPLQYRQKWQKDCFLATQWSGKISGHWLNLAHLY